MLLFDGVCNLCSRSVGFIIRHDKAARFRFASLQSEAAQRLLARVSASGPLPDSMIVIDRGRLYARSDAALKLAEHLPFPLRACTVLRVIPRPVRDAAYRLMARNRYTLFGKRDSCMVPTPALVARFLR